MKIDPYIYTAPEKWINPQMPLTMASDIWSLGIVIYYLLTKKSPFLQSTPQEFITSAYQPLVVPQNISPELAGLLFGMLQPLPDQRLNVAQVLQNQYFAKSFFQIPGAPKMQQINTTMQTDWNIPIKRLLGFLGRADIDPRAMDGSIALLNSQIVQEQQKFQNSEKARIQAEKERDTAILAQNAAQDDNKRLLEDLQALLQSKDDDQRKLNTEITQLRENIKVLQSKLKDQKSELDSDVITFQVVDMDKSVNVAAGGARTETDVQLCKVNVAVEENVE
ncbi:MAG: hypothetical protein EZS28_049653, partial [Streblomastix strix]